MLTLATAPPNYTSEELEQKEAKAERAKGILRPLRFGRNWGSKAQKAMAKV
jgi:hypothetical protein